MWVSHPLDQHKALTSWYWTVHIQFFIQVQTKHPKTHKVSMLSTKNHIYSLTNAREGDYYLCHPKYIALIVALHYFICLSKCQTAQQPFAICLSQKFGKETSDNHITYKILIDIGFQYLDHRLERHCSTNLNWDFIYSKGFNNCYILLSNISQTFENTKFIAGELSRIVSLVLYCPMSVYELW